MRHQTTKGASTPIVAALTIVPLRSEGAKANGLNARALPAPGGGRGLFFVRCAREGN